MTNRVTHFNIQADDTQRAEKFYSKVFGWKFKQVMKKGENDIEGGTGDGRMDYWLIDTGKGNGISGGMTMRMKEHESHHYDCTIEVKDIYKTAKAIKASGGKILMEPNELPNVGKFARAQDSEGNVFDLMEPTGKIPEK